MLSKELIAAMVSIGLFFVFVSGILMVVSQYREINGRFWSNFGLAANLLLVFCFLIGFSYYRNDPEVRSFFLWLGNCLLLIGLCILASMILDRYLTKRRTPKLVFRGSVINTRSLGLMEFKHREDGFYDIVISQDSRTEALSSDLIVETTVCVYRKKA